MLNRSTQSLARTTLRTSSQVAAPAVCRGAARVVASAGHPYRLTSAAGPSSARQIHHSRSAFAQSTTPNSSLSNPAEKQAQAAIEDGTGRMEAGDWQGAKECYERSITISSTSTAHFNLGVTQFRLGDLPAAIASFEKSITLSNQEQTAADNSPTSSDFPPMTSVADAHTNLASCYIMSSPPRPDLAIHHLQTSTQLDPSDGETWFNLGAVFEACERLLEARDAYGEAEKRGVERARENSRNVGAKILSAKVATEEKGEVKTIQEAEEMIRNARVAAGRPADGGDEGDPNAKKGN